MRSHKLALPALILASIISGTGSTAVKLALRYFDPLTLLFLRLILASSILLLFSFLTHQLTLVFSRRLLYLNQPLTRHFSPVLLTTYNSVIAALITLPIFLWVNSRPTTFTQIFHPPALSILLFIVIILSIGMYLLYQWGIKHTSSLTAGSTIYLSPLVSAAIAIPVLGEQLTPHLLFGGAAILIGVYLAQPKSIKRSL